MVIPFFAILRGEEERWRRGRWGMRATEEEAGGGMGRGDRKKLLACPSDEVGVARTQK